MSEGELKRLSIREFVKVGYLQEVNRRLLHPCGLALAVELGDDGEMRLSCVFDSREDPEGFVFGIPLEPWKARRVASERRRHEPARRERFGWVIQPADDPGVRCREGDEAMPRSGEPAAEGEDGDG